MDIHTSPLSGPRWARVGKAIRDLNAVQRGARDAVLDRLGSGDYHRVERPCPLCATEAATSLSSVDMYGLPMGVVLCHGCAHVYTRPIPDAATLDRFYNDEYRRLDRGTATASPDFFALQSGKGRAILALLREQGLFDPGDGHLVVEIGCGMGGILTAFRDAGAEVCGCDLGQEYIDHGRNEHGLDLVCGGVDALFSHLGDARGRVDLVIVEQALEHFDDPIEAMWLLRLHLPEHALVYIGVPGLRNLARGHGFDFLRYLQFPHLSHFDLGALDLCMARAGFERRWGDDVVRAVYGPVPGAEMAAGPFALDHPTVVASDARAQGGAAGAVVEDTLAYLAQCESARRRRALLSAPRRAVGHVLRALRILPRTFH